MSHFNVAVITDDLDKVEELLAPYDENLDVPPYISLTKDDIIGKSKHIKEMILSRNFSGAFPDFVNNILKANTDEELYEAYISQGDITLDNEGNILSTYNPNSMWDYYEIGGRWNNLLALKITKDNPKREFTNIAKIKDIDFDYMNTIFASNSSYLDLVEAPDSLAFYTYATLNDGKWLSVEDNIIISEDGLNIEYINKFKSIVLDENNQDKYMCIVDCHI